MDLEGKYGVAQTFYLSLQDTDGDYLTSHTFAAGDIKIGKDGGALANVTTLPTLTNSQLVLALSATEMAADQILIMCHDQTATPVWKDSVFRINTQLCADNFIPVSNATEFKSMERGKSYRLLSNIDLSGEGGSVNVNFYELDMDTFNIAPPDHTSDTILSMRGCKILKDPLNTPFVRTLVNDTVSTIAIYSCELIGFVQPNLSITNGKLLLELRSCVAYNFSFDSNNLSRQDLSSIRATFINATFGGTQAATIRTNLTGDEDTVLLDRIYLRTELAFDGAEMDLIDDAITSAKYDESTAYPVRSELPDYFGQFISVSNATEFKAMERGKKYKLTSNIDLSSETTNLTISFSEFDFNGYTITLPNHTISREISMRGYKVYADPASQAFSSGGDTNNTTLTFAFYSCEVAGLYQDPLVLTNANYLIKFDQCTVRDLYFESGNTKLDIEASNSTFINPVFAGSQASTMREAVVLNTDNIVIDKEYVRTELPVEYTGFFEVSTVSDFKAMESEKNYILTTFIDLSAEPANVTVSFNHLNLNGKTLVAPASFRLSLTGNRVFTRDSTLNYGNELYITVSGGVEGIIFNDDGSGSLYPFSGFLSSCQFNNVNFATLDLTHRAMFINPVATGSTVLPAPDSGHNVRYFYGSTSHFPEGLVPANTIGEVIEDTEDLVNGAISGIGTTNSRIGVPTDFGSGANLGANNVDIRNEIISGLTTQNAWSSVASWSDLLQAETDGKTHIKITSTIIIPSDTIDEFTGFQEIDVTGGTFFFLSSGTNLLTFRNANTINLSVTNLAGAVSSNLAFIGGTHYSPTDNSTSPSGGYTYQFTYSNIVGYSSTQGNPIQGTDCFYFGGSSSDFLVATSNMQRPSRDLAQLIRDDYVDLMTKAVTARSSELPTQLTVGTGANQETIDITYSGTKPDTETVQ